MRVNMTTRSISFIHYKLNTVRPQCLIYTVIDILVLFCFIFKFEPLDSTAFAAREIMYASGYANRKSTVAGFVTNVRAKS